ncbi:ATP-binding protein [Evansella sp. AB-P1]|uniref:sensor histidine kinase n=1 Tax=Evansella sp. AB-P1 TaxID=3037653 RepID=UPI00241C6FCE|nr:ATP-binding protein [Evansella sp. AB-P1]MDG5788441.1 ATP-binding protein [Evansella sp. AB-P1]
MKLKARLLAAFLTSVILPIVAVIGLLFFYSTYLEHSGEEIDEGLEEYYDAIYNFVMKNYELLEQPDKFYELIEPLMYQEDIEIIIISNDGNEIFKSTSHGNRNDFLFTLRLSQIQVLSGEVLSIEFKSNSIAYGVSQPIYEVIISILIIFGIGILLFITLIIGWTVYISRTILIPLKQIYIATEEMKEGNLDYKINYSKHDEIGKFIQGFNLMRDHLKQLNKRQEQYEKNRKELIATISHDLRTPLQSIKGYVEGINDGIVQNEEMKKRYLHVILSKTEQLNRLIEDLFEFSKMELDQLTLDKSLVNSKAFFEDIFQQQKLDMMEQMNITLFINSPFPDVVINIDEKRIIQVITNLLENSCQYGSTKLNINSTLNETENTLELYIEDNGSGIEEQDIPKIFEHFYRGDKSRSRNYGGTGLGLAIAKSIIEGHEGSIWVRSKIGEGSTFVISLPIIS